jgi:hypothetical protein
MSPSSWDQYLLRLWTEPQATDELVYSLATRQNGELCLNAQFVSSQVKVNSHSLETSPLVLVIVDKAVDLPISVYTMMKLYQ